MDILISSNLERLLYLLSGSDEVVRGYMRELSETGRYQVSDELLAKIREHFDCGFCDDNGTAETIKEVFTADSYLIDTHTAVGWRVLQQYREKTGDTTVCVLASTASPFKFCTSVLSALGVTEHQLGTKVLSQLQEQTGRAIPKPLASLEGKSVRFAGVCDKEQMPQTVLELL